MTTQEPTKPYSPKPRPWWDTAPRHPLEDEFPGRVTFYGGLLQVRTVYGEPLANKLRALGAKWNREVGRWEVPLAKEAELRAALS